MNRKIWFWFSLCSLCLCGEFASPYTLHLLNMAAVYVVAVLGLYFVVGLCGQFSLAQGAFFGLGAYGLALLEARWHFPAPLAIVGGALVAAFFGLVLGLPTLRLRGHYLAMATIGFGEIVNLVFKNWISLTNGPDGLGIPRPFLAGSGSLAYDRVFYLLAVGVAALVAMAALWVRGAAFGRQMAAVRDNELAAATLGIAVTRVKVAAFALAAFCGGLAGAMYALLETYISPETFTFDLSVTMLMMLLVGGRYSVAGAAAGAVLLGFLPEWLRFLKDYYMLLFGALVTASVIFLPAGIAGLWDRKKA
jgi:branched-chain amino acid transport system permease protein